jgi:hypothetical protein
MTHDPDVNAAHGRPVAPPEQRNWGPGGPSAKSADRRLRRTMVREDSAVVTCCAHHGRGGIITVFVVVVPAKTLVPLSL